LTLSVKGERIAFCEYLASCISHITAAMNDDDDDDDDDDPWGDSESQKHNSDKAHFVHRMVEQEYKHLDKFPIQVQFQFLPPQFIMFNKTM
jgi:hypothetical protein